MVKVGLGGNRKLSWAQQCRGSAAVGLATVIARCRVQPDGLARSEVQADLSS